MLLHCYKIDAFNNPFILIKNIFIVKGDFFVFHFQGSIMHDLKQIHQNVSQSDCRLYFFQFVVFYLHNISLNIFLLFLVLIVPN